MKNIIKDSAKILYNNSIFIQPLIIFVLIANSLIALISNPNTNPFKSIIILVLYGLLAVLFWAGWSHINKLGVETYNPNDEKAEVSKKSFDSLGKFATGVGENFLKFLLGYIAYFFLSLAIIIPISTYLVATIGLPEIISKAKDTTALTSEADIAKILTETIPHDFYWWIFIILGSILFSYAFILYTTILASEKDNFLKCIGKTIIFFFKNILGNLALLLFMLALYFGGNILVVLLGGNIVASFVWIIYQIFYFQFCMILMLRYYNEKNKTNCNRGAECIGQDKTID